MENHTVLPPARVRPDPAQRGLDERHRGQYDRLGRTVLVQTPLLGNRTTTFDAWSRTVTSFDAAGIRTRFTFDDVNRNPATQDVDTDATFDVADTDLDGDAIPNVGGSSGTFRSATAPKRPIQSSASVHLLCHATSGRITKRSVCAGTQQRGHQHVTRFRASKSLFVACERTWPAMRSPLFEVGKFIPTRILPGRRSCKSAPQLRHMAVPVRCLNRIARADLPEAFRAQSARVSRGRRRKLYVPDASDFDRRGRGSGDRCMVRSATPRRTNCTSVHAAPALLERQEFPWRDIERRRFHFALP